MNGRDGKMARTKSYGSVADWVAAEYTVSTSKIKNLSVDTLAFTGMIVSSVHPRSPASHLGIQVDDILYEINGGIFDEDDLDKTFTPRLLGRAHKFSFFRPSTHEIFKVKGAQFPYGLRLKNSLQSFIAILRNGDPDPSEVATFWEAGDRQALADLWIPFEAYLIRLRDLNGNPFDGPLPQTISPKSPLPPPENIWPGFFGWLALCAAEAGQMERASYVQAQVDAHFEQTGDSGMMNAFAAMEDTRALLAEARFNPNMAITYIERGIEMAPDVKELYRRLSALTNTDVTPPPSSFLDMQPSYDLPRVDPAGRFKQESGRVSLSEQVAALSQGQFILLVLMSAYRTNGPYVEGFNRALIPLLRLEAFQEVHIVTAWGSSRSRDLPLPIMEPALQKGGIKVSLLHDVEDKLAQALDITSAPTNLIIDHRGVVIAEGWLGEDNVLWDALNA